MTCQLLNRSRRCATHGEMRTEGMPKHSTPRLPRRHASTTWSECSSSVARNFSTIGCDHAGRFDSMEAICGALLVGIMVAGFSHRTRY